MWYDIFVMDYTVYCWDFLFYVLNELGIADSWAAEIVDLDGNFREFMGELYTIYKR
jgi:hypothetical protein